MIDQLIANIKKTNAPIVVGLDPMMKFIPEQIQKAAFAEYGETLKGAAEAIWQYNKGIVDAVADLIPAVKPQIAMYEQFGVAGLIAFQKTVAYCKEKGLVVIGDVKRGDIGSTSEAYAVAHLGKVVVGEKSYAPFDEDFARATGTKAGIYNLMIAIVVAVVIVMAMNLVGSLLISALVIFPALSAMRMFKSFRSVTICAAALSVFCALIGILVSILAGTPVGSAIVAVQIIAFGLSWLAVTVIGGVRK